MSTGNEISKGVSATDYEQQVKRLKRNLFDCQEAAKDLAQQATKAEAERDALAARLKDAEHDRNEFRRVMNGFAEKMAELEGQEPVAWMNAKQDMASLINFHEDGLPLYARPVPAEMSPEFTDTARSALLWVLWHHQGGSSPVGQPIRYALGMDAHDRLSDYQVQEAKRWAELTNSETRDFHRRPAEQPVNARLLDVATGKTPHLYEGRCPDSVNGPESRDPDCPACQAITSADAAHADPVNVDFGKRGENMFFKIGNQSFLLDYKPEEQVDFDFMKAMLLSAFSRITHGVKTETQPVNARLLDALRSIQRYGLDTLSGRADGGDDDRAWQRAAVNEMTKRARIALSAAEAQQAELVDERVIDRTWARFCGAFGDGPDAPYPGMIASFEIHYGQSFRDKEWRTEAACWAAAWSKATARADAKNDSYRLDALEAVAKASGTGVSFDWCRHVEDGMVVEHGYRMMCKHTIGPREKSIRHAIDAAMGEFKP